MSSLSNQRQECQASNPRQSQADVVCQDSHYELSARYYDLMYSEQFAWDGQFYLDLAAETPGGVLELGCGTGRITLPLARAGHHVTALDLSPDMLGILWEKLSREPEEVRGRIEVVECGMQDFSFDRRFGLVISPFRAFQHLMDPSEQRACLDCILRHLEDGGRYVHNVFAPSMEYFARIIRQGPVWVFDRECADEERGTVIHRHYLLRDDFANQTREILWKYEEYDSTGRLSHAGVEKMGMRWQYRWEAEYLLKLSGFEIEQAYGDFDNSPLNSKARELIYVCKRASQ